jgi:repressor LexA
VPNPANDVIEIPLHGRIAAGVPIEAIEGRRCCPSPPRCWVRETIMRLRSRAIRWSRRGSFDGDLALIRRTDVARDGEIVVALVRGEEATLKYLRREAG